MRIPKYRKHSLRDIAFVEWRGQRHYFSGPHNSAISREAYRRFIVQVVAAAPPTESPSPTGLTVAGLVTAFLDHAAERYGRKTRGEYANCKHALRPLLRSKYGPTLAAEFGPKKLKAWRGELVTKHSRKYINAQVNKIRRAFKWAVSEELVPITTLQSLETVTGLYAGESEARETVERRPVDWKHVEPVLQELSPMVADMLRVQWLTAVRSDSLCRAAPEQFDLKAERGLWLWRPRHKTENRGRELIVPIGPQCQAILRPYMEGRAPDAPLFDPRSLRSNRRYGARYKTSSYYRAVVRAIKRVNDKRKKAGKQPIENWFPHLVRHSKGQAVREDYGIEGTQAHLGHDTVDASQIYSSRRLKLAKRIARKTG